MGDRDADRDTSPHAAADTGGDGRGRGDGVDHRRVGGGNADRSSGDAIGGRGGTVAIDRSRDEGGDPIVGGDTRAAHAHAGCAAARDRHRSGKDERIDRLIGLRLERDRIAGMNARVQPAGLNLGREARNAHLFPEPRVVVVLDREIDQLRPVFVRVAVKNVLADVFKHLAFHGPRGHADLFALQQRSLLAPRTEVGRNRRATWIPADEVTGHGDPDADGHADAPTSGSGGGHGAHHRVNRRRAGGLDGHGAHLVCSRSDRAVLHEGIGLAEDDVGRFGTATRHRHASRSAEPDRDRCSDRGSANG